MLKKAIWIVPLYHFLDFWVVGFLPVNKVQQISSFFQKNMLKLVTVVVKLATLLPVDKNANVFESWWLNHQLVVESTIGGKDTKVCQNLQLVAKTPRVAT